MSNAAPEKLGRRLTVSVSVSVIASLLALLVFVLPAEYGIDPTGLGDAMGISQMSTYDGGASILSEQPLPPHEDEVYFELAPFESVEYKYELSQGQVMVFAWSANEEVVFDLHGEELDAPPEEATSFATGRARQQQGAYHAPFTGRHGWFFENRTAVDVTVTVETVGFAEASIAYSNAGSYRRELSDESGSD